ncbi:hypothetical protein FKM82_030263 [Ascaphus truei]
MLQVTLPQGCRHRAEEEGGRRCAEVRKQRGGQEVCRSRCSESSPCPLSPLREDALGLCPAPVTAATLRGDTHLTCLSSWLLRRLL